jgi:hypothetical protein
VNDHTFHNHGENFDFVIENSTVPKNADGIIYFLQQSMFFELKNYQLGNQIQTNKQQIERKSSKNS